MMCFNRICLVSAALILWMTAVASFAAEKPSSTTIFTPGAELEELWNSGVFTEGVAVGPDGRIYFSDISGDETPGKVYRFDPKTGKTDVYCPDSGQSNGLMFTRDGRLIAACGANHGHRALCEILSDGTVRVLVGEFEGKTLNSPNDLVIHPGGAIYFSDPRYVGPESVELDHMSVFRFEPHSKTLTRVTTNITKPNGVILSPDGMHLYVAETNNGTTNIEEADQAVAKRRMTLNRFPVHADGSLGEKSVLVDFGQQLGIDGMTVDTAGHVYAAVRSAERFGIAVYTPDGKELAFLKTPGLPTNCCFGTGAEAKTLYLTVGTGLYRIQTTMTGFHPATARP